jgi:hypothetical protein
MRIPIEFTAVREVIEVEKKPIIERKIIKANKTFFRKKRVIIVL